MPKRLTASDRSSLIKLASNLQKGSEERKAILSGLKKTSAYDQDRAWTEGSGLKSTLHIRTQDGQAFKFSAQEILKSLRLPYVVGTRADAMPVVKHWVDDDLWHTLKGMLVLRDQADGSRVALSYTVEVNGGGRKPWSFDFVKDGERRVAPGKRF
jgi:hypothetical protein